MAIAWWGEKQDISMLDVRRGFTFLAEIYSLRYHEL